MAPPKVADPASDAPDGADAALFGPVMATLPASYAEAMSVWRTPSEVNAWIGARFEYDHQRALQLSESQRASGPRIRIHEPELFFERPAGVCVDLARFAVETLRTVAPAANPAYLVIEFDPVIVSGHTLRRHWIVQFEVDGKLYFFADSKRPGYLAGPYQSTQQFIDQYAQYRQRRIVSFRVLPSYERRLRQKAPRADRATG